MKTIVCNTCTGGRIYQQLNREYDNPFMWCYIPVDSYITLVKEYDTLDFNNISTKVNNDTMMNEGTNAVSLYIDGKVDVQYVHHHVDPERSDVFRKGVDLYYNDMLKYVEEMYLRRLQRRTDDVLFLFDAYRKDEVRKFLDVDANHQKVLITMPQNKGVCGGTGTIVVYDDFTGGSGGKARRFIELHKEMFA